MAHFTPKFKEKVLKAIDGGLSQNEAAKKFKTTANSISKWRKVVARPAPQKSPTELYNAHISVIAKLRDENNQLRRIVVDNLLQNAVE